MPAIEDYETTTQAAERFGIDPSQVRRYCEQGRIAGIVKVANRWLIPKDSWPVPAGFGRPPEWAKVPNVDHERRLPYIEDTP